ncbi:18251_t:CDS:2, partial [Racocetra persica]
SAAVKAELKNLKSELKKKNRALAKMDQEKVQKGTFLATNQLISQGAGVKEPKNVVYYDPDENRQVDDKDQTYSLIDRLTDEAGDQLIKQEIRSQDTQKQINNLINSLSTREEILITRLYNKIKPRNLIDIYYLAEEEEKSVLQKELTKVINSRKKVIEEEIKEPKIIALVKEKQEGK